jgi:hypothetical protein
MCRCDPIIKLTPQGERLKKILTILFFIYFLVIIGRIIIRDYNSIISDFITIIILMMTMFMCHYMIAGFLIWKVLFDLFYTLVFLGLRIQNKVTPSLSDPYEYINMYYPAVAISSLTCVFYCFLIYYAFQAYKEFKAIFYGYGAPINIRNYFTNI